MATFLLFGITGDLARNKIVPALFNLYARKEVNQNHFICIGVGRKKIQKEEFHNLISESIAAVSIANFKDRLDITSSDIETFRHNFVLSCMYIQGEFNDPRLYSEIKKDLEISMLSSKDNAIFCKLSLPPSLHSDIVGHLIDGKIMSIRSFNLLIEKPFGSDASSARKLFNKITEKLDPKHLILIDHYLGKEPVIDLENIRLSGYGESLLSSKNIKEVEVRLLEIKSIGTRGAFYDQVGALQDVGQNHLLQVLAVAVADYSDIRELDTAKSVFIGSLRFDSRQKAIFGQYKGYLKELHVNPESKTETFFSVGFKSNLKKWAKTKFRVTSGKCMQNALAEIIYTYTDGKKFSLRISEKGRSAYEYILLGALHHNVMLRADIQQIIASWKLTAEVKKHQNSKNVEFMVYEKNTNSILKLI
ncbi:MAG: hypothetical protein WCG97_00165 [bacterium]